jgi:hypothetical protein
MDAGLHVIGYDLIHYAEYPGEFRLKDVRSIVPDEILGAVLIVASPPCDEFSRHDQPWTRRRNPPLPDLTLVETSYQLARALRVPLILENVRGAQKFIGPARAHFGKQYLWGDGIPALLPYPDPTRQKQTYTSARRADRAIVPRQLARWVGECYANNSRWPPSQF